MAKVLRTSWPGRLPVGGWPSGLQPAGVGLHPRCSGRAQGAGAERRTASVWRVAPRSEQPVHLVGASIGAWRMATPPGALAPDAAFRDMAEAHVTQRYDTPPGEKRLRPTTSRASALATS